MRIHLKPAPRPKVFGKLFGRLILASALGWDRPSLEKNTHRQAFAWRRCDPQMGGALVD